MTITARRAATQSRLLEAASQVFVRRGVTAATVEEICEEAGFTRGAFYSNFESKDDLCLALLRAQQEFVAERAQQVLQGANISVGEDQASLGALVERVLGPFLADSQMLLVLTDLRLYAIRQPEIRAGFQAAEQTLTDALLALLDHALADHGLTFTLPGQQVLTVLQGTTSQRTLDALSRGGTPDIPAVAAELTDVLLHFLVDGEGRPLRIQCPQAVAARG